MVCPLKGPHVAKNVKSLEAASKRCRSSGLIFILFAVFTQSLWPNAIIFQSKLKSKNFQCCKRPKSVISVKNWSKDVLGKSLKK